VVKKHSWPDRRAPFREVIAHARRSQVRLRWSANKFLTNQHWPYPGCHVDPYDWSIQLSHLPNQPAQSTPYATSLPRVNLSLGHVTAIYDMYYHMSYYHWATSLYGLPYQCPYSPCVKSVSCQLSPKNAKIACHVSASGVATSA